MATRRQVTARLVTKYQGATQAEKSAILGQLCVVNGWHRDHARKALPQATAGAYPSRANGVIRCSVGCGDAPVGRQSAPSR